MDARRGRSVLLLVPFVVLLANAHAGYWRDLEAFRRWSVGAPSRTPGPEDATAPLRSLYRQTDCTYPALGGLLTAGGMRLAAHVPVPGGATQAFRLMLSLADAALLVLVLAILVRFGVDRAWWWTLAFALWPSTWAGTAVWGQFDAVTMSVLLVGAWCLQRVVLDETSSWRWLVVSAACLAAAVHLKQLAVFALPALIVLQVYATAIARRRGAGAAAWLVPLLVAVGVLVGVDRLAFEPPDETSSILVHAWSIASRHTRQLSINGPNVWALLGRPGSSPSADPLIGPLSPAVIGPAMFVVQLVIVVGALAWRLVRVEDRGSAVAWCLFVAGLSTMLMAVWLTGVHERYLTNAFPLLFLGLLGLRATSPPAHAGRWLASIAIGAAMSGAFVLRVLYVGGDEALHVATALVELVVGTGLTVATVRTLVTASTVPC